VKMDAKPLSIIFALLHLNLHGISENSDNSDNSDDTLTTTLSLTTPFSSQYQTKETNPNGGEHAKRTIHLSDGQFQSLFCLFILSRSSFLPSSL